MRRLVFVVLLACAAASCGDSTREYLVTRQYGEPVTVRGLNIQVLAGGCVEIVAGWGQVTALICGNVDTVTSR